MSISFPVTTTSTSSTCSLIGYIRVGVQETAPLGAPYRLFPTGLSEKGPQNVDHFLDVLDVLPYLIDVQETLACVVVPVENLSGVGHPPQTGLAVSLTGVYSKKTGYAVESLTSKTC